MQNLAPNVDKTGIRFKGNNNSTIISLYCAATVTKGVPMLYVTGFPTEGQEHKAIAVAAGVGKIVIPVESRASGKIGLFYIDGECPYAAVQYDVDAGEFLKGLAASPTELVYDADDRSVDGVAQASTSTQTILTSGTLVVGNEYLIIDHISSDDFTNVGAASNADGVTFTATGTTPTTWTNSSTVVRTAADAGDGFQKILLTETLVTIA